MNILLKKIEAEEETKDEREAHERNERRQLKILFKDLPLSAKHIIIIIYYVNIITDISLSLFNTKSFHS